MISSERGCQAASIGHDLQFDTGRLSDSRPVKCVSLAAMESWPGLRLAGTIRSGRVLMPSFALAQMNNGRPTSEPTGRKSRGCKAPNLSLIMIRSL